MSARLLPVSWTPAKRIYDLVLAAGVAGYILAFLHLAPRLGDPDQALDGQSLAMKAYGSCAFLLLTLALVIGPLARLDPRLLPLLYNRRHLGVVTFLVALSHAIEVLGWHFAYSPTPPLVAMLSSEPVPGAAPGLPFVSLGLLALLILFALAATSHDAWLSLLGPPGWKALHMAIYPAYALVVAHVAFGALQDGASPVLAAVVVGAALGVAALHLAAAWRGRAGDAAVAGTPWVDAGPAAAVPEGRAIVVRPEGGEAVAIFRHGNRLSAVTNLCAHQNGPLGEGRIVDGCITCPWHGFQYRPEDGCAPPPYTEKLATYRLALAGDRLLLDPRPNPPGTRVEPLALALPLPPAGAAAPEPFFIGWARSLDPALRRVVLLAALGFALGMPALGVVLGATAGDAAGPTFATVPGEAVLPDLPAPAALRGVLLDGPYPLLHLPAETPGGRSRTLLLARDGKLGAQPDARALHGRLVSAEGFVLRRGTIEMLVAGEPLKPVADTPGPAVPAPVPLGRWRLQGEICDGKCAAGGMRPGTGIGHRACATLCLDGELPAVFVPSRPVAGHGFLLLGDAAGGPALPAFRDLVGRRVTLEGEVERLGDILVFRAARP
ncbi:Rieske 2Fe-2S domain-containing protein [Falsiroseomonas sp. HW251]|uniref:Rieske 2Fe-2S domain-containing protein n=1 Tax=Falsiroseomonas sp. HW251 TaxID=3390998 RepID=UPI003D31176E